MPHAHRPPPPVAPRPPRDTRRRPLRLLLLLALPFALAGCGSAAAAEVTRAAEQFESSLQRDPAAACSSLAPETRDELETTAGHACAAALPGESLPAAGAVVRAEVDGHSAQVVLAHDTLFLALFDDGWRVTAAGCRSSGPDLEQPYDCTVKAG